MAPKQPSAASGQKTTSPVTRSNASKAAPSASKAPSSSKTAKPAAPSAAASASKAKNTAPRKVVAGPAAKAQHKASSKSGSVSNQTLMDNQIEPRQLESALRAASSPKPAERAAASNGGAAASGGNATVPFMQLNDEQLFDELSIKFKKFDRLREAWMVSGQLDPATIFLAYKPSTFIDDIREDVTSLDRATAHQIAVYILNQFVKETTLDLDRRREWAEELGSLTQAVVQIPLQEVVDVPDDRDKDINRVSEDSVDASSLSRDAAELRQFVRARTLDTLNASTVFGLAAGFSVVPHEQILNALRDQAAAASASDRSGRQAAITWPRLSRWDAQSWIVYERKWWNCVNQSVEQGQYMKMMSLIDTDLFIDIQHDLKIGSNEWFRFPEIEFLRLAHGHFGPKNKEQAKDVLSAHSCEDTNRSYNPGQFLHHLSQYNTKFLRTVDLEIAPSIKKWPNVSEAKYGPVSLKTIRKAFQIGFSKLRAQSIGCEHCFDICEQNPNLDHSELYHELRAHFQYDEDALKRKTLKNAVTPDSKRSDGGSATNGPSRGGRGQQDTHTRENLSTGKKNSRNGQDRNDSKKPRTEFPLVQGKDRGQVCGDYNNHYGAGCSAATCLVFGTAHAKKKGYTWKNSREEPKVTLKKDDYDELKRQKPEVVRRNTEDRNVARANATSKPKHYSSSAAVDLLPVSEIISPTTPDNPFAEIFKFQMRYASHMGDDIEDLPPLSMHVDIAPMAEHSSSEPTIGNRFFGMASFPELSNPIAVDNRPRLHMQFQRNVTTGSYCRQPKKMLGCVSATAPFNAISPAAVSHSSQFGKLKRLDTKDTPRPEPLSAQSCDTALLAFKVQLVNSKLSTELAEWFVLDKALPADTVILNSDFMNQTYMDSVVLSNPPLPNQPSTTVSKQAMERVFFDSGAQMSCISPCIAARFTCVDRRQVDVDIIQMGNVVAKCNEVVQLMFNLFDSKLQSQQHVEWFLLWDNPYGIILGSEFCKQFTTWQTLLAPYTADNIKLATGSHTSKNKLSNPWEIIDSNSVDAVNKRKRQHRSLHPITGRELRHRDAGSRPQLDGPSDHRQLPSPPIFPGLFTESARREAEALSCRRKEKRVLSIVNRLPAEHRVAFDVAEIQMENMRDQVAMIDIILSEIVGLPEGLKMHCGASGIIRRSHLFLAKDNKPRQAGAMDMATNLPGHDAAMSFLARKAQRCAPNGSDWTWSSSDEEHYSKLLSSSQEPIASPEISPPSSLTLGAVIQFVKCVRQTGYNGMLGRLYSRLEDGRWQIRVLGKNQGQFVTAREENFVLHNEQRSFATAVDANFHEVGIDDGGMPIEDVESAPRPVHRQFGKQYSAALTLRINELLDKYKKLFDDDISEPCDFEEMDIVLKPNAILPNKARYYKNTPAMREEVRRQVEEQLAMGIIEKAQSPVVSNVLLVKRPHMPGRYRFVVDYQKINEATVPDQLMMPDIKTQHDRLANKCIFGAVDIRSYYRLINLKKECRYLTAFATDEGVYVYNRVAMGLRNACSHAQRELQTKLANDPILGIRGANIRNYFDDIAWGSSNEDEFMTVLQALLDFGVKHKLKYNLEKSCFGVDSITHVGFIANKDGIKIDPERTRDIVDLQEPKSTRKVQSILGVLNFVRNFIPNFSVKAKFLTDRLDKSTIKRDAKKFVWTDADAASFRELKELVLTAPLLSVLDYSAPIHIRCDSSRFGCGAVLFQFDIHGRELPVCYASRKYTPAETRYSTFQQEMGAVVWALERFLEYTQGYKVIVETDHRNIAYVKRSAMPQLARWRMRLEAFDFDVHYRCGAQQEVADGLSRSAVDEAGVDDVAVCYGDVLPSKALSNASPLSTLLPLHVDAVEMAAPSILYDDRQSPLSVLWARSPQRVAVEPFSASDASEVDSDDEVDLQAQQHQHADDVLQSLDWTNTQDVKQEIMRAHNDMVGHGGVLVTLQRMLRRNVPNASRKIMLSAIDAFLSACPSCQKMRKRPADASINRRVIKGFPFEELSVDILKLPFPDAMGHLYVVTIVDNFSHWVSVYPCQNKSAVCAARALVHHMGVFGVPLRIRSDGGGEFVNDILLQLRQIMDCQHIIVHPYLHTANGIAERANRAILDKLRFMLFDRRIKNKTKVQWSDLLPFAQRIVNASFHSSIGTSPAQIIFGGNIDLDRCILSRRPAVSPTRPVSDYIAELSDSQYILMEAAELHQEQVHAKLIAKNHRENAGKPPRVFEPGELVLVKPLKDAKQSALGKLAPRLKGPLTVESIDGEDFLFAVNPVTRQRSRVLTKQCELWNSALLEGIEGAKIVAQTDGFEFAVDSIIGHGFINADDAQAVIQLPADHRRSIPAKNYAFSVKWSGYEQPSWLPFKVASALPMFRDYVSRFPGLRM